MVLLHVVIECQLLCCTSSVVEATNRKQQNTAYYMDSQWLKSLTSCPRFCMRLNPLDMIRDLENCDIVLTLLSIFFTNPHNYYNDYNKMLWYCLDLNVTIDESTKKLML